MVKMSSHIVVEGISQVGKTHVQTHGDTWTVIGMSGNVSTLKNQPGLLIQSVKTRFVKWIGRDSDEDFTIVSSDCS